MAWNITLEAAGPGDEVGSVEYFEGALDDLLDVLEAYDPVIIAPASVATDGSCRFGAELTIPASSIPEALNEAAALFGEAVQKVGLPLWPLVSMSAKSDADLDAELAARSFPEVLGVAELAERLNVSKSRASELARDGRFPQPVVSLASGPIWLATSVARYVESWDRKPGRPAASAS